MTVVVVAAFAFVLQCYDGIMEFEQSLGLCPSAISSGYHFNAFDGWHLPEEE